MCSMQSETTLPTAMIRVAPCPNIAHDELGVEKVTNNRSLLQMFNRIIWVLRLSGISTGRPLDKDCVDNHVERHVTDHADGCLHTVYCVLVTLYMWAYTVGLIYKVSVLDLFSSTWIQTFQFMVLNLLASVLGLIASLKAHSGSFQRFVFQCDAYEKRYGTNRHWTKLLKKDKHVLGVLISFWVVAPGIVLASTIYVEEVGSNYFLFDGSWKWPNYILSYMNSQAMVCVISSLLVSATMESLPLTSELDLVNEMFQDCCEDNIGACLDNNGKKACHSQMKHDGKSKSIVELIRRHEHVNQLISSFSGCISFGIFTAFTLTLPLSCFNLYLLLTHVRSTHDVFLCGCNLGLSMLASALFVFTGARMNIKAHAPLQYVWRIPTTDLSGMAMRELMHFTAKLTGTSIGYSVYGFFTINLPTVLTIVGTLVTYFVIVVQFRPSATGHSENTLNHDLVANLTRLIERMQNTSSLT